MKDPERLLNMGWPEKLERVTGKMGARFCDFDLKTGTWSFRVQHFSNYGLAESDEVSSVEFSYHKVVFNM